MTLLEEIEKDKDQLIIHVTVTDQAFHNLAATPEVTFVKGCKCEECSQLLEKMLKDMQSRIEQPEQLDFQLEQPQKKTSISNSSSEDKYAESTDIGSGSGQGVSSFEDGQIKR